MDVPPFLLENFHVSVAISSAVAILYGICKFALRKTSNRRLSRVYSMLFRSMSLIGGISFARTVPFFNEKARSSIAVPFLSVGSCAFGLR
jgi:hypothetical protein